MEQPSSTPDLEIPEEVQKDSHKQMFVFLGIIAFFAVGLGGVFLGKYLYEPKTALVAPGVTPTQAPIVTPTPDPTAEWKIYTNEKSQFSLRIPLEAKTTNRDPDPFPVAIEINNLTPRIGGGGGPEMVGWLMIISEPQANNERLSLLAWADKYQLTSTDDSNKPQISTFTVGNKRAISWIGSPFHFRYILIQKSPTEAAFILINPGELNATDPFFDQILSTFKFIDESVPDTNSSTTVTQTDGVDLKDIKYTLPKGWETKLDEKSLFISSINSGGFLSIRVYNYQENIGRREYYCQVSKVCIEGTTYFIDMSIGNISGYVADALDNSGGGPEYFGAKGNKFYIISSYGPPPPNEFEKNYKNVLDSLLF